MAFGWQQQRVSHCQCNTIKSESSSCLLLPVGGADLLIFHEPLVAIVAMVKLSPFKLTVDDCSPSRIIPLATNFGKDRIYRPDVSA